MNPYMGMGSNTSFNPYSAGRKMYGGGRDFPTMGRVDPLGYRQRDNQHAARRDAMLRRLQSGQRGAFGSANYNRQIGK